MIGKKVLALVQTGLILLLAGCGSSFDGKADSDSDPAYIGRLEDILDGMDFDEQSLFGLTLAQWQAATGLSFDVESSFRIYENDYYKDTVMIQTEIMNDELTTAIVGAFYLDAIEQASPEMPINTLGYKFGTEDQTILTGNFGQLTTSSGALTESEHNFLYYLFSFQMDLDEARKSELGYMDPETFKEYQATSEFMAYALGIDYQVEINDSAHIQEQIQKAIIAIINRGLVKDA